VQHWSCETDLGGSMPELPPSALKILDLAAGSLEGPPRRTSQNAVPANFGE
jgi:hypothetical protein